MAALSRLRAVASKHKIVAITAWDYPTGLLAESAGIDLVLVGDSLGIAALGHEDTTVVTLDQMVHHTRAVTRAVKNGFVMADLPLGSYEKSIEHGNQLMHLIQPVRWPASVVSQLHWRKERS